MVMAAIAALELNQKRPKDAAVWLEKAHADSPAAVQPAIRLATFYLRTNQVSKALNLIRNLQLANPGNAELLELLGQIQQANNDQSGALETYNKLVSVMPTSADARFHLATAHLKLKNEVAAAEDLKKALAIDPHFMQAKLGQVDIAIATGNSGRALTLIQQIQKDHATSPVGYLLEGDLLVAQGKTSQAISSYQRAFVIAGTPQVLIKLSRAMKSAGQTAEANAKLAQWMKEHPAETLVPLYTAENALALKQYKTAIAGFEDIIHREPANVVALNNLAWAYLEDKDVRALATAERAFKLAGDNPSVLDTFGWVLVQHGNVARGLPILQRAASTSPDSSDIRYHLALGLNRSGDKVNARKLLQQLLVANGNFAQADEARILLKQL
jgi:putative PEP-CTERM system TPR-repeat lipoprotein